MKKKILSLVLICMFCFPCILFAGCGKGKGKGGTINIIMTSATIPPMVSMLDTIGDGNETYMWVGRQNTIYSVDNLKDAYGDNCFYESWSTASNIPSNVINAMSQKVANAWYNDNNTKFNIYVTDYGILAGLYLVKSIGVDASHYNIHMVEDGSGAYGQFYDTLGLGADGAKAGFDAKVAELNAVIATMENGTFNSAQDFSNYDYVYAAATLENVDYYLQYPEMLTSEDAQLQAMITNNTIKLVKKHQTQMYQSLSSENKAKFKSIILNPALDTAMTPATGKSGVLMITGTSFTGEGNDLTASTFTNGEGCRFEQYVNYLVDKYGDDYTIVYKGHPSWGLLDNEVTSSRWYDESRLGGLSLEQGQAAAARRKTFLESKGVTILPAQTPAEAFIWAYSDVLALCGYDSSLYFNAPQGKVLCILADEEIGSNDPYATELGSLNQMLFKEGGQLYNADMYFLDLDYISANPVV